MFSVINVCIGMTSTNDRMSKIFQSCKTTKFRNWSSIKIERHKWRNMENEAKHMINRRSENHITIDLKRSTTDEWRNKRKWAQSHSPDQMWIPSDWSRHTSINNKQMTALNHRRWCRQCRRCRKCREKIKQNKNIEENENNANWRFRRAS